MKTHISYVFLWNICQAASSQQTLTQGTRCQRIIPKCLYHLSIKYKLHSFSSYGEKTQPKHCLAKNTAW